MIMANSISPLKVEARMLIDHRDGIVKTLWKLLMSFADGGRRVFMNILFLALLIFVFFSILGGIVGKIKDRPLKEKSALVLDLEGALVEEATRLPQDLLKDRLSGAEVSELVLRDLIRAIELAQEDKRIDRIVLMLDSFQGGGLASLKELGLALERFRESGKEVVSYGSFYDQRRYFIASFGDEIFIEPMGGVFFTGLGGYRQYYKDAFDRLGLKVHVRQTGAYKNFAENLTSNEPSEATIESRSYLLNDLWNQYMSEVEQARGLEKGAIDLYIQTFLEAADVQGFDFAKQALEARLVDDLKTIEEFRREMIERGALYEVEETKVETFRQISLNEFLKLYPSESKREGVAILVAQGGIVDGSAGPGSIGGRSMSEQIRRLRFDPKVEALVFRVNSPGGSAFASELIRRELELFQETGRPVVISMSDVAASGGYWVSLSSDHMMADSATITGSIGVIGMMITAEETMKKLSLHVHGQSTTWIGEAMPDMRRPLDPRAQRFIEGSIDRTYATFLKLSATARKTEVDELKTYAEGRVWTGTQALENGLVDSLGGLTEAVAKARELAKLDEGTNVFYWEREQTRFERIIQSFSSVFTVFPKLGLLGLPKAMGEDLEFLLKLFAQSEKGLSSSVLTGVAHCFCDEDLL